MADPRIRIADVLDEAGFRAIPPCADPGFDHRTCDYWEDADRGSKAARLAWLEARRRPAPGLAAPAATNPFLADADATAPGATRSPRRPTPAPEPVPRRGRRAAAPNPFAPPPPRRRPAATDAPRKWQLLGRGLGVTGSYAKVLLRDDGRVGLLPVRPADRLPAGAAHPRPVPGAAGRAAPGGHHLHRDDRGRARRAGWACGWSPRSATTSRAAGSPPSRPTPRPAPGPTRRAPRPPRSGCRRVRPRRRRRAVPRHAPRAGVIRMRRLPVRAAARPPLVPRLLAIAVLAVAGRLRDRQPRPARPDPEPRPTAVPTPRPSPRRGRAGASRPDDRRRPGPARPPARVGPRVRARARPGHGGDRRGRPDPRRERRGDRDGDRGGPGRLDRGRPRGGQRRQAAPGRRQRRSSEIFRAAYDRVACEQAGGVAGSARARPSPVATSSSGPARAAPRPTTSTSPTA